MCGPVADTPRLATCGVLFFGWINAAVAIALIILSIVTISLGTVNADNSAATGYAIAFGILFMIMGIIALVPSLFEVLSASSACGGCAPKCRAVLLGIAAGVRIIVVLSAAGSLSQTVARQTSSPPPPFPPQLPSPSSPNYPPRPPMDPQVHPSYPPSPPMFPWSEYQYEFSAAEYIMPVLIFIFFLSNAIFDLVLMVAACNVQSAPQGDVQLSAISSSK